ncbi:MAG: hypothetical protein WCL04_08510 [Verrucomicrobiota bacterium]
MKRIWKNLRETMVEHAPWEMFAMRALLAWLMWRMLPSAVPFTAQLFPSGLARLADLTFLSVPPVFAVLRVFATVALPLYVLGAAPLFSLGYLAALFTAVGALENSQGAIGHHLQLLCLVALSQWLAYAAAVLRAAPGTSRGLGLPAIAAHRYAVQAAKLMIAAAYVSSGWTKLIASRGQWVMQLPDISLQLVKTHANVYYDYYGTPGAPPALVTDLPRLIAEHPWLTRLAFTPGLLLELGAVLALTGRRAACVVGLGLLGMHVLARVVMELGFVAHEWLLVIFFINIPWLVCTALRRWRGRAAKP